ncbi:MAG: hypothetical protein ACFFED_03395 [Candidatus Thorarchaeota archaeon]
MTDEECLEEVTIIVFPPIPGIGIIEEDPAFEESDSCGDSSTPLNSSTSTADEIVIPIGIKDPMIKIKQLLRKAEEKFGNSICIRIASYGSKDDIEQAREWLNAALRGSGNPSALDEPAFSEFIGSSAPIFSINNRLSFVGLLPNESQFLSRIGASLRMATDR